MTPYRRLPLKGLKNARELGGYPTVSGVTKFGVFVRSEVPAQLSREDIDFLRDYGLTDVIDLRGASELEKTPDVLSAESGINYVHVPLFDRDAARGALPDPGASRADFTWEHHYKKMAENGKDWVHDVLTALTAAKGCALFHCTTGKDRTGIITALLLGLCGVSQEDIAADYCVSSLYLKHVYARMHALTPDGAPNDFSDPFFSTAAENMLALTEHLQESYGGIEGYVRACGVSDETMQALKAKLLQSAAG